MNSMLIVVAIDREETLAPWIWLERDDDGVCVEFVGGFIIFLEARCSLTRKVGESTRIFAWPSNNRIGSK